MIPETIIDFIAKVDTNALILIVGAFFFKDVKGGVKIPILRGNLYVNKKFAIVAFIVMLYLTGWFYDPIQNFIKDFISNQTNLWIAIGIPILIFYIIFEKMFFPG